MPAGSLRPSKILAVHLSYRSRAAERGRTPAEPSYFLKAPSTLTTSGTAVVRPLGCRLLAFEGEIALVIGTQAKEVTPDDAWAYVGAVTAANDFGVYDLRAADPGSNVHSKGFDGYTPVGPDMIDARNVDPATLRVRTWVNGELAQEARVADDYLFTLQYVIADLSRMMTLEAGDLILTGTPTGSSVVEPGDVVEVEVDTGDLSSGRLRSPIEEGSTPLSPWGAMPAVDDAVTAAAYSQPVGRTSS